MNDLKYKDSNASLNFAKMVRCCIEIVLKNFFTFRADGSQSYKHALKSSYTLNLQHRKLRVVESQSYL